MANLYSAMRKRAAGLCASALVLGTTVGFQAASAQDSTEAETLPSEPTQSPIGYAGFLSPDQPFVHFRSLPTAATYGNYCDPLVFAPNMFGTITRGPQLCYLSNSSTSSERTEIYRLFADNDGSIQDAEYSGDDGLTTLNLFYGLPLTLGSPAGPVIAVPSGDTLTSASPLQTGQAVGFQEQILENADVTAAALTLALAGETMAFDPTNSVATLVQSFGEAARYNIDYAYIYTLLTTSQIKLGLPNPVDGALVGRTLVSSNANPLPRTRFLYDFDYLSAAQLSGRGVNLQRHLLGWEQAFFGGQSSITVRVPFASTLDTNIVSNSTQSTSTSLGNVQIDLKTILFMQPTWLVSGGLGISTPTANDVRLLSSDQTTTLIQVGNETVVLKPFVAGLWTPNQRVFSQSWMYANFDTSGNPVAVDISGNWTTIGRLNDAAGLGFETQLGYWLISPCESTGWLRGLAPFGELHYLTSVQDSDVLTISNVSVFDAAGRVDEFYATVGAVTQIQTNCNATLGLTLPMLNHDNRFSDWNLGFRVNYFFGGTAANRAAGYNFQTY